MTQVKKIITGAIQENCYIVYFEARALIVDPGNDAKKIIQTVTHMNVQPMAILLTHAHFDHIGALDIIRKTYQIPVYVSPEEQDWLADPARNLSKGGVDPVTAEPAEHLLEVDQTLEIGPFACQVRPTPGHSPGSVSFVFPEDGFVIAGDALFKGSVGRTDLPGSEPEKLIPAIKESLFTLPDETVVHPGHGMQTTVGYEKKYNPYFNPYAY